MIRFLYLFVFSIGFSNAIKAQDEHFSQFYAIPVQMNPALAGASNGTYRISAINRDQWNNNQGQWRTFVFRLHGGLSIWICSSLAKIEGQPFACQSGMRERKGKPLSYFEKVFEARSTK